jgi:hypothetical protein
VSSGGPPWDQWHPPYPTAPAVPPAPPPRVGLHWAPAALLAAAVVGVVGLLASWSYGSDAAGPTDAFAGASGGLLAAVLALAAAGGLVDLLRRRVAFSPFAGVPALLAVMAGIVLTVRHWAGGAPPLADPAELLYGLPNAPGVLVTEGALALVQVFALAALPARVRAAPGRTSPLLIAASAVVAATVAAALALTVVVPVGDGGRGTAPSPLVPSSGRPAPQATARPLTPASVSATCTSPPGQDSAGNRFDYRAEYAVDGDPGSAWRCDGDGVGQSLRLDLGAPRTLTRIDVVPGFAKTDPVDGSDRYAQCRRLAVVRFDFDDTSVQQTFDTDPLHRDAQTLRLPGVSTRHVTMTILASVPGTGVAGGGAIDKVAVSTLSVVGA